MLSRTLADGHYNHLGSNDWALPPNSDLIHWGVASDFLTSTSDSNVQPELRASTLDDAEMSDRLVEEDTSCWKKILRIEHISGNSYCILGIKTNKI